MIVENQGKALAYARSPRISTDSLNGLAFVGGVNLSRYSTHFPGGCREMAVLVGRADKRRKQRVRGQRLRFELGMELAAKEPGMLGRLDDLDVGAVRRASGDAQARRDQCLLIIAVELVAVAVTLADLELSVGAMRERAGLEPARPGP